MTTDPRWSAALYHLCALWNTHGPERTIAGLKLLAASEVTPEGLLVLEIAPREGAALCPAPFTSTRSAT